MENWLNKLRIDMTNFIYKEHNLINEAILRGSNKLS